MAAGNNRLTQGLDVRYTAALCFLAARGYERTGVTQDMMVDLERTDLGTATAEAAARRGRHTVSAGDGGGPRLAARGRGPRAGLSGAGVAPGAALGLSGHARSWMARRRPYRWRKEAASGAFPPRVWRDHTWRGGGCLARWAWRNAPGGRGVGAVLLKRCLRDLRADGFEQGEIYSVGPHRVPTPRRCRPWSAGCCTSLPSGCRAGPTRSLARRFALSLLFLGGAVLGAVADVMPGERDDGLMLGVGHCAQLPCRGYRAPRTAVGSCGAPGPRRRRR